MSESDNTFRELMDRVQSGSESAARELCQRYEFHLLDAIRRKLNEKIRSKFDSVEFAQGAWASFFASSMANRRFESPKALIAYLTRLAKHKVIEALRQRLQAQKYDVNRERSMDDSV